MNKLYIGIVNGEGLGCESLRECKTFSNLIECKNWLKEEFVEYFEDIEFEMFDVNFDESKRNLYCSWSDDEEGEFLDGWIVVEEIK